LTWHLSLMSGARPFPVHVRRCRLDGCALKLPDGSRYPVSDSPSRSPWRGPCSISSATRRPETWTTGRHSTFRSSDSASSEPSSPPTFRRTPIGWLLPASVLRHPHRKLAKIGPHSRLLPLGSVSHQASNRQQVFVLYLRSAARNEEHRVAQPEEVDRARFPERPGVEGERECCGAQKPRFGRVTRSFLEFARPAPPPRPHGDPDGPPERDTCFVNIVRGE
jgi:hypothetical protein